MKVRVAREDKDDDDDNDNVVDANMDEKDVPNERRNVRDFNSELDDSQLEAWIRDLFLFLSPPAETNEPENKDWYGDEYTIPDDDNSDKKDVDDMDNVIEIVIIDA